MELSLPLPTMDTITAFVLVLTRLGAALTIAPLFSSRAVPFRMRAIIAVILALFLLPSVSVPPSLADASLPVLFGLMLKEALVGLAIGLAIGVALLAWAMGGAVIDLMAGFSYGGILDPQFGAQSGIMQQLYTLLAGMIFISINGVHWLMMALQSSFDKIPLLGIPPGGDFAAFALQAMTTVFITGLGVIAPVFLALLLTDVAFGLISRAAPQTQIIQVEFPVKIAVGIVILIVSLPLMTPLFEQTVSKMLNVAVGGG